MSIKNKDRVKKKVNLIILSLIIEIFQDTKIQVPFQEIRKWTKDKKLGKKYPKNCMTSSDKRKPFQLVVKGQPLEKKLQM